MNNLATRINIADELEAAKRGECLSCRIKATHELSRECFFTPVPGMAACKNQHMYNMDIFGYNHCPICEQVKP